MEISLNCERFGDECLERLCGFLCHAAFNVAYGREICGHKFCILYLHLKSFFHSLYESKFHMASLNVPIVIVPKTPADFEDVGTFSRLD